MSIKCGIYMTPKKRPKFDEFVTYAREQGITDDYAKSGRDEVCRGRMKHWNALLEMNKRVQLLSFLPPSPLPSLFSLPPLSPSPTVLPSFRSLVLTCRVRLFLSIPWKEFFLY
mmetsp:Transcript_35353/g.110514  ORF Transcript_35353/g.110514 Transcript_35353/m.110514 type:complete len:113 (-) Transcript_35353:1542-1880(-)